MGSVKAVMAFVFNEHTQQFGFGREGEERLKFTWDVVAESQELKKDWNFKQAINTSLLPK
jgi:hypothetical protein